MSFQQVVSITPTQLQDAGQTATSGPLASLDLTAGGFDYKLYKYPISAPNPLATDMYHEIIFYINIPTQSYWNNMQTPLNDSTSPVANRSSNATLYGLRTSDTSTIPGLTSLTATLQNAVLSQKSIRTTAAVSLYIPNSMVWSQNMKYENVSLSESAGVVADLAALGNGIVNGQPRVAGAALGSMAPDIASFFGKSMPGLSGVNKIVQASLGLADNPQNFVLFKQIDFRHFRFDFILTPENANESQIINQIIYLFRFHSAPEVAAGSVGRFFVPPSSFDIDVLHNGTRNTNIPRISTCVLESVNVDYAGAGSWVTTYDGQPTQIRLGLSFSEVEIMTKDRISSGF